MYKQVLIANFASLALSVTALAGEFELYPSTNPRCNMVISQPANSSGIYLSKDCTAAYILPPKNGIVKVVGIHRFDNLQMCPALEKAMGQQIRYQDLQEKILQRMARENLSSKEREDIRKDVDLINGVLAGLFNQFKGVPGAEAQVSYNTTETNDWLGEFLKLNPNVGADHRMKFHPAPIAESVVVFKGTREGVVKHNLDPVVEATIPGLAPVGNDPSRLSGIGLIMNGALSGQLTLGLPGSCAYYASGQKDIQDLVVHMVANVTYAVPVISSVGYAAKLDSNTAVTNLVEAHQSRTQFSKNESSTLVSQGSAGDAFTFHVTEYELKGYSDVEKNEFFGKLREEVRLRLAGRLVDQMTLAGFLEMSKPAGPPVAPDPGHIDQVHTRRECSSHGGFLGIGARSRCEDIPYIVKIPQGSTADTVLRKINNTSFNNSEIVSIRAPIYRYHTGSFLPKSE